jgi:hypothetical protein
MKAILLVVPEMLKVILEAFKLSEQTLPTCLQEATSNPEVLHIFFFGDIGI